MHNSQPQNLRQKTVSHITPIWGANESEAIADLVLEFLFNFTKTDIIINNEISIDNEKLKEYDLLILRLLHHEPIQYITERAAFYGRDFIVNEHVLIPRQETESLIQLISNYRSWQQPKIADIGTGSGCIACSLALEILESVVQGFDISEEALAIASKNAQQLGCNSEFSKLDILNEKLTADTFDIVVSNPPYVLNSEKKEMKKNVLSFEPAIALFVPDDNPLLFYHAIAKQSHAALKDNGVLFIEINEQFGSRTAEMLEQYGFAKTQIHRDLHEKERFVSGIKIDN
jgi:release factor glutamine methyltransferase